MKRIKHYFLLYAFFLLCFAATAQFGNYFAGTNAGTGNTGSYVTGVGYNAVHNNNSGSYNSALGYASLYSNKTGYGNTAVGYKSLFLNTKGSRNTAIGDSSLYANTTGVSNTANGYGAMFHNTTGYSNTATGRQALYNNTTGFLNTATGFQSLYKNTLGIGNTANGHSALYSNTTGNYNTSVGDQSLFYNTTGNYNTANGFGALFFNTTGHNNTATGNSVLIYNGGGSYNSANGDSSLFTNITGSYNTAIGFKADVTQSDFFNTTAIGYNAKASASNTVRIGNDNVVSIGGQVGWTNFSDARIKNDVKENVPGLAFINLLRPVTYHFNIKAENELLGIKKDGNANAEIEKINFTGLLAQEVEKAAQKINYDFSGIDKSGDVMGLRYAEFVVPLVKAVQELDKNEKDDIAALQKENRELKERLSKLEEMIDALSSSKIMSAKSAAPLSLSNASLSQNIPNPFTNSTTINYILPQTYSSAKIIITDNNGKTIKEASVSGSGKGSLNVDASMLASGAYQYALYINNKLIDAKQMILAK